MKTMIRKRGIGILHDKEAWDVVVNVPPISPKSKIKMEVVLQIGSGWSVDISTKKTRRNGNGYYVGLSLGVDRNWAR
jgi:hypothetical protein